MNLTGSQLIGNTTKHSTVGSFTAYDPATGKPLMTSFYEATAEEVEEACILADQAFNTFRHTSRESRARFLDAIADEIIALGDDLIQLTMQETGLPEGRLKGERGRTVNQLRLFAEVVREGSWIGARIDTAIPDREPLPRADIRMMNVSLGPVAVFGASNFPLAFSVAGGDTASALAAGCPVVVKGHPAHPGTSELVGQAILKAVDKCGMPEGTFSLVQGQGIAVGQTLVQHPKIKAVAFTGSFRGGRALYDLAASRPEPITVYAEMGSTNPVFILPGALKARKETIAQGLVQSTTLGVGQFCTNPGLVFGIQDEEWNTFLDIAGSIVKEQEAGVMLHKGIQENYEKGLHGLGTINGVFILGQGKSIFQEASQGIPTLLTASAAAFLADQRMEEEVFGPSTLLISCDEKNEILKIAQSLQGHLTATIHATEEELPDYAELIDILAQKAGRLVYNGFPTGVEVCHAMVHGGPYPATTDSRSTSVGTSAIFRFLRPVCYQNIPHSLIPEPLKDHNPWNIMRMVNGMYTQELL